MTFDRTRINLRALNSLTKYPSIPTYHELDPRNGGLLDNPVTFSGEVIGTEKVDGTNSRIVMLPDGGYMLGSRENLLYASGDLIGDPTQGIVENLRPVADGLNPVHASVNAAVVFYLELYGGKIGGQRIEWPAERISTWRDSGGQEFAGERDLTDEAKNNGFDLTPRLFTTYADTLPHSIEGMHELLTNQLPETLVGLDDSGQGRAEGIVLRAADRSVVAKARFQDYERTLKRRTNHR
jgi:hypothetical protein